MTENDRKSRSFMILIHLICWVLIMSFPFLFIFDQDDSSMDWQEYFRRSGPVISYCILFYLNYFMLIPKMLFRERQKRFLAVNALAVIVFCLGIQVWLRYIVPAPVPPPAHMPKVNPSIIFFLRDAFIMILTIGLAAAIRLNSKLANAENARRIENAFKHGVSSSEESFIDISFSEQPDSITCTITNSCHPKNRSDKSGSGIGLEQVRRRLELIYPGKYEWKYGTDNGTKTYFSNLTIWTARNKPYGSTA